MDLEKYEYVALKKRRTRCLKEAFKNQFLNKLPQSHRVTKWFFRVLGFFQSLLYYFPKQSYNNYINLDAETHTCKKTLQKIKYSTFENQVL